MRRRDQYRTIERMPLADSMAALWVTMPTTVAGDVWGTLTTTAAAEQAARRAAGLEDPGLDALRVDALVGAILGTDGGVAATAAAPLAHAPRCRCGGAHVLKASRRW